MKTTNVYDASITQFIKLFGNLSGLLDKLQQHADAKKFDPANVLTARLAPDQLPFMRQIQIMSDTAKFAASRLTGKEAPAFEDKEQNLADIRGRIQKTVDYLKTFKAEDFAACDSRKVTMPRHEGKFLWGSDYLHQYVIPNVYFHYTTAYAILRHNGVDIGKKDLLGTLPFEML